MIARPLERPEGPFFKDLLHPGALQDALDSCRRIDSQGQVWLETDMRAHRNPTRMRAIRRLGAALVRRLRSACPGCGAPGWGMLDTQPGLPSARCAAPTLLTATEVWGCLSCGLREYRPRRDGLDAADAGECSWCNP